MNSLFRQLPALFLALCCLLASASAVFAEKRVGVIMTGDIPYYSAIHEAFAQELSKAYADKEEIEFILQRPFPNPISWSNAARKLIAFDVDLIVTYGAPATQAAIYEKSRIPIVYAGVYEPDQAAVAARNVTGCGFKVPLSSIVRYLKGVKTIKSFGVVASSIEEDSLRQFKTLEAILERQDIKAVLYDIRTRHDLSKLEGLSDDAVFITGSSLVHNWLEDILATIGEQMLPVADIFPDYAESGILMTLAQPAQSQGQVAAQMAAEILGGRSADALAPQTIRDTELVFNLIEARRLGINFPIHLLIEASKVIE